MSEVFVSPIQRSAIPIGTVEEAVKEGLDTTVYATCSRPNPQTGHLGCDWYAKCRVSAKGKEGPRNYGCEILKGVVQGGGFVRTKTNCMWIADHVADIEANGGSFKVVANEGEEFEVVTGVQVNTQTGARTFQKDPLSHREVRRVTEKVPPYPRPGENPAILNDVLRAESAEVERERISNENRARNYGLSDAIPPIDKRSPGTREGHKASGGGGAKG